MRGLRGRLAPWLVTFLACLAPAGALPAAEIAGLSVPDTVRAGGRELKLNAMALLKKLVFRVYVVALYLPAAAHEAEGVVGPDVPKVLTVQFLRAVSREEFVSPDRPVRPA